MCSDFAKLLGAKRIIAMSRHEDRAALARLDLVQQILLLNVVKKRFKKLSLTNGYGADAALECVETKQTVNLLSSGKSRRASRSCGKFLMMLITMNGLILFFGKISNLEGSSLCRTLG